MSIVTRVVMWMTLPTPEVFTCFHINHRNQRFHLIESISHNASWLSFAYNNLQDIWKINVLSSSNSLRLCADETRFELIFFLYSSIISLKFKFFRSFWNLSADLSSSLLLSQSEWLLFCVFAFRLISFGKNKYNPKKKKMFI